MSRRRSPAVGDPVARSERTEGLTILGLRPGERVRFRRGPTGRWQAGIVTRRERDGSVGVTDGKGAARAIAVDRIEVGCTGSRGAAGWEPLTARAARSEQLRLL
jgi:hypothetical protein